MTEVAFLVEVEADHLDEACDKLVNNQLKVGKVGAFGLNLDVERAVRIGRDDHFSLVDEVNCFNEHELQELLDLRRQEGRGIDDSVTGHVEPRQRCVAQALHHRIVDWEARAIAQCDGNVSGDLPRLKAAPRTRAAAAARTDPEVELHVRDVPAARRQRR